MSTILERRRHEIFRAKAEVAMTTPSLTATAEKNVMSAENQVHKLFLRYVETVSNPADFFDARNRDLWLNEFRHFLAGEVGKFGASND